jgi:hypothetical protein
MAVVAFFAGEFASYNFNLNIPAGGGGGDHSHRDFVALDFPGGETVRHLLPWILLGAAALVILVFVFLYVHAVFRFILFDSVVTGRCSIRQGWLQRSGQGAKYFVWLIMFQIIAMLALLLVIGLPLLALWRAGIFSHAGEHIALLVLVIFLLVLVFLALLLVSWAVATIVKDFLVPIMALEGLGVAHAWHTCRPTLAQSKGSVAAYLGMKLLLALLVAFVVGIISLLVLMILLIPSVVYFLLAFGIMSTGKMGMIIGVLLMVLGGITLFVLWFGFVGGMSVPVAVFFQSYALYYFGSRYPRLAELLWPASNQPLASST